MIVVTVELHSAVTGKVTTLGQTVIFNVGTSSDGKLGDYGVSVGRKTDVGNLAKITKEPLRRGIVRSHPRLAQNVWRLVLKALAVTFPEQRLNRLSDIDSLNYDRAQELAKAAGGQTEALPVANGTWMTMTRSGAYNFKVDLTDEH